MVPTRLAGAKGRALDVECDEEPGDRAEHRANSAKARWRSSGGGWMIEYIATRPAQAPSATSSPIIDPTRKPSSKRGTGREIVDVAHPARCEPSPVSPTQSRAEQEPEIDFVRHDLTDRRFRSKPG